MTIHFDPKQNHLLAALPELDWLRWLPHLEPVTLSLGQVLYEAGDILTHVYFPTDAVVSLLYVMHSGESAEIAVVGHEGVVGIALFMGGDSTSSRAVVQNAGHGFRMSARVIKDEFNRAAPVLHLLLRYTQALMSQMTQTAACNKHHSLHQQLCRWLLLTLDRLSGTELDMTQQLIANMLGVTLDDMKAGAALLEKAGMIRFSHGHISVLDRPGLERLTCECYAVVKKEYDRLLPVKKKCIEASLSSLPKVPNVATGEETIGEIMNTRPSELDPTFLARQRQLLLKRQDELGQSAATAEAEEARINGQALMQAREVEDDAQRLDSLETRGHLVEHAARQLAQVLRALKKMDEGTYGYSDVSGQRIPDERLTAIPETTRTLAEQKASEDH